MTNRALLVVDMQNGFCHPDGSFPRIGMGLEGAEAAVRNAAVAVAQARSRLGAAFEDAWAEGSRLTLDEAVERARR